MSEVFLGQILLGGFDFAPKGFALCNGQILPVNQNQALYSLLGTQYGGNGATNFALPDFRGRTPLGASAHNGQGNRGGASAVTLTQAQMPAHQHRFMGTTSDANAQLPLDALYAGNLQENVYASANDQQVALAAQTLGMTGSGHAHDNMQPSLAINFSIALSGIFPSRT